MLERITFIARPEKPLTRAEIGDLVAVAQIANFKRGVTGALLATPRFFLQILEGPRGAIDAVMKDIAHEIEVLAMRSDCDRRLFPTSSLKAIVVDEDPGAAEIERRVLDAKGNGDIDGCEAQLYRAIWKEHRWAA